MTDIILGCLQWICGVTEVFLGYCFVDLIEGKDLVHRNKIRVGIFTVVVGSLLAMNRCVRGGLVSWMFMLLQSLMVFGSVVRKIDRETRKRWLGLILAYNIFSCHIQLILTFILLVVFQNVGYEQLYYIYGVYKVGCSTAALAVLCVIYGFFSKGVRKYHLDLKVFRRGVYVFDLVAFYLIIFMQMQVEDYGLNRNAKSLVHILMVIGFVAFAFFAFLKGTGIFAEIRLMEDMNRLMGNSYQKIRADYQNFVYSSHDMKNHLTVLRHYCERGELDKANAYIEKLQGATTQVKEYIRTDSEVADMLLNQKLSRAEKEGIEIVAETEPLEKLPIGEDDWCMILSNLLDNAIEACQRMTRGDRWIRIQMKPSGDMTFVEIANTFSAGEHSGGEHRDSDGRRKRGKRNRVHGYGKKSVKARVEKYGGIVHWSQEKEVYKASITFFNKSKGGGK